MRWQHYVGDLVRTVKMYHPSGVKEEGNRALTEVKTPVRVAISQAMLTGYVFESLLGLSAGRG